MTLTGQIILILPVQSGTSQRGEWQSQDFILNQPGEYPKKAAIRCKPETLSSFSEGDDVTVHVNIESREHNNKYYTSVSAWKIEKS